MTFSEWIDAKKKKEQEDESSKPTISATTSNTASGSPVSSGSKISFSEWIDRKKENRSSESVQGWIQNGNDLVSEVQQYFSSWKGDDEQYRNYQNRISNLLSLADGWRKQYASNPEAVSTINSAVNVLSNAKDYALRYRDYYANWETEDDYNKYISDLKDYDNKRNLDINEADKEIDFLEREFEDYVSLSLNPVDDQGTARLEALRKQYGDTTDLADLISEKKAYRNQAKHIQEGITLSSATENEDFDTYRGYVSTKYEDGFSLDRLLNNDSGYGYKDLTYEYINNQNDIRSRLERRASYFSKKSNSIRIPGDGESSFKRNGYDLLTEDEVAIYNYYYAKEGKEKAEKYLDSIQETLNLRKATGMYKQMEDKTALELAFGARVGLDQFYSGAENLFNTEDDYIPQSAYQYASGMVREDLADDSIPIWYNFKTGEWEDKVLGSSVGQVAYDTITTTANMAPSVLSSIAANMIAPGSGAYVGNAMMFASSAGGAYQEALNSGYDKGQARVYSTLVGGSEVGLQYLIGGISSLGGKVSGNVIKNIVDGVDNAFARVAINIGGNMLSEGIEEGLQEILTPWFKSLTLRADEDINWREVAYSTLLGALTAGIMEGPGTVSQAVNTYGKGRQLQKANISAERLAKIGKTFAADTVAYQLAGKVNENTGAYTIGRLFNEIGATLTDQNISDITDALVKNNMPQDMARKNAEALAYVVEGGQLTDDQIVFIEGNDVLAEAARSVLIDDNTTWNQRTKGYNEVLKALADEVASQKASRTNPAKQGEENAPSAYTVDAQKENGTESLSEADIVDTTPAKVKSISSIENGNAIIKLEDGSEVSVKDADLDPADGVRIETIASIEDISTEDANFVLNTLRNSTNASAQMDSLGAKEAYKYGFYGLSQDHLAKHGVFANYLSETQRQAIYKVGQKARQQQIDRAAFKNVAVAKSATPGIYFDAGNGNVVPYSKSNMTALDEKQSAGVRAAMVLRKLGIGGDIYFFKSYVNDNGRRVYKDKNGVERPAPNGWYSEADGSIHIDLNAGNKGEGFVLYTLSHELTHFIEQWSPKKYKILADFLIENYEKGQSMDELVLAKQKKLSENRGKSVSYSEAYSEVIADSMEAMLADGNVIEKLLELKSRDNSLFMKMKQFFDNLLTKIRNAYKGLTPDSDEGKAVLEMQDSIEKIQQLFADALVDASENYQSSLTPGEEGVVVNQNGDPVAHATTDGTVQLSMRTYDEDGREAFRKYLQKCVTSKKLTKAEMNEMLDGIEDIYQTCKEFKDKYAPFGTWSDAAVVRDTYGKPVFSVVTPNGEYKMNLDFSLVCKKRRTLDAVFNEMSRRGIIDDFELGQKSVVKINEIIRKHGLETACALCFVDAKRFRQASMADQFTRLYNELVMSLVPEDQRSSIDHFNFSGYETIKKVDGGIDTWDTSKLDFSHINHVLKTYGDGTVEYKSAKYIKTHAEGRKLLLRGDFMSSKGFDAVKTQNKDILKLYNSKKGTGGPKAAFGDVQYMNEIIQKARSWTPAKAYSVGGIRIQSFSDYVPRMVFDYVQMVYDLAATKLPAHAYTKEALFVKQFGLTGIKINMSLIPAIAEGGIAPGLDANGNYVWAGESFDYDTAKEIQNAEGYTENCGTICVGVSYEHIKKLLRDPNIRMVIPYHKSGLNPIVAHMNKIAEFTDYTNDQRTKGKDGKAIEKDFDFSKALHDMGENASPKAVADQYLKWCASNGYTARFAEFAAEENYYKLLEDFTLYDKDGNYVPQREVRALFPKEGSAFGSMKDLIKSGLEEDAIIEGKRDSRLASIVDEIQRTIPKTEAEISEEQVTQADRDLEAQSEYEVKYSERVTDKDTLDFLNSQETVTTYKTMQIVDGKLYPPMASRIEGKHEDYSVLGQWEAATEHPELITKDGKFKLDKGKGNGSIQAAYNPYMHSSNLVLNDQFSGAYKRDNLVTVECEVPVSEVTSGYHAKYAKDSVGWHPWHTGTVAGQLRNATGTERQVFLSRWIKPVRIVPDVEVASMYKSLLNGTDIAVPENVVTPSLLKELKKAGVPIKESGNVSDVKFSVREIVGHSGKNYGAGVYLDSALLENLTEDERVEMVKEHVKELGGSTFTAYDGNHNSVDILLVESNRKFRNKSGKRVPVLKDMTSYLRSNVKQEAIALIDELILTSSYEGVEPATHPHDWVDNNGENDWDVWTTYIQDKKNTVWEAKLRIANSTNGDKILYDIFPIKKVEEAQTLGATTTNGIVSHGEKNVNRFSERTDDSVSNRSLLANAFDSVAQNDYERQKIQEYKGKVDLINAEERKLSELNEQIKELSFSKGPKDTKAIRNLQFEARQTANRINTYDKQLLRLEASKPLQDVLQREKKAAYKRAEQKGKEALEAYRERTMKTQRELLEKWQESRKKGIDSRHRTAMRHKIKNVVNELNQYLLRGTKDRHIPIELQKPVAEALNAVNMDTVGAEERIAKLKDELLKAKTPEQIQEISRKIDHIQEMGDRMNDRLQNLKDAYDQFVNSDDPMIANSHDEVISNKLQSVIDSIGNTPLRDMTLNQLEDVYDMYRMVLTTIRNANKAFKANKSESISVIANQVMEEVEKVGGKKKQSLAMLNGVKNFVWNNLKPVYAFEHIGSDHLTEVFNNVRAGEDVWAVDVTEAREFYLDKSKKYNYDSWDFKKRYKFTSTSGMDFDLSLEQIMSLYAYSKREQAAEHLKKGGIVIDETTEITVKNKLGIPVKFNPTEATAYNISEETLDDIVSKLTEEQKGFVDEMQDYLSTVMGAKGNEVSLVMYGIKLFKEKFYFPLKSAHQFMAKAKEQQQGVVKIKNAGFSKETVQKASNPIVLTPFMNVWANHVNEMSMYHAFVLPMEDFYRVYNYKTPTSDTMATKSVEMFIQNAYGKGATQYIDQLLKDLNGGARTDSTTGVINKMMGLFKKGAVFASLSVVVQQPSAIARAAALVDTKYFIGHKVDHKRHKALWDEVKQYAPVAIIKEMGYFDTNMGKSTQDFITAKEYSGFNEKMKALFTDSGYRDEVLSKAPALADEIAWCGIWEAVKRETKANNPGMDVKSDAFLKKAGERFTEVIVKTQVYDSVLSRSGLMRSKDTGMKMATAFMAEPTTSINMIADALLKGKRGDRKYCRSAIGAVIASQILNSILVSFVYAGRDDDEDKTYLEKYIGTLAGEVWDSLNPAGYIPFIKDIQSIVKGYDVERSDMAVISDLWKAWENLSKENVPIYRKVEGFAGSIAQIFGLPVKNIMRDARGIYQTVMSFLSGQQTTKAGIGYAVKSALPKLIGGGDVSNQNQLYEAYLSGDNTQIARVEVRFKDKSAINSAIRKALRENDPRIKEAAEARYNGDLYEYTRLAKQIIGEKHFSQDNVVAAINAEINAMDKGESTASSTQKASGLYNADDFAVAVSQNDHAMANAIKVDIIQTAQKNGKTEDEAEKSFVSSAMSGVKNLFLNGDITESQAVTALQTYCDETEEDSMADVQYWAFKQNYPDVYADDQWFDTYYEKVAYSGISIDVYMDYRSTVSTITGEGKKNRRMAVINSLPITSAQKDALYYAEGWVESKLYEAPWH